MMTEYWLRYLSTRASLKSMPSVMKVEGEFVEVTLEEALFGHERTTMAQATGQPDGTPGAEPMKMRE